MTPTIEFQGQRIEPQAFQKRYLRTAGALRAAGVGPGDVIALMMRNSPLTLELMLAARWIGAQWCPVNWHFKTDEVSFILSDSGAKVFVADADLLNGLPGLRLDGVRAWVACGAEPSDAADTPALLPSWQAYRDATAPLDAPASPPRGAMFYTSGTTGRPKGIRRAAANPEQAARGLEVMRHVLGLEPGMRALLSAPMYHSAPNSYSIGVALESAQLFIEERFDAERTLRLIEQHRITHAYLVPTMYVRLLRLPEAVRRRHDLSSMRFVASTGSPCPPDVKRAMIEWWGPVIHEAYGSSELGYMTRLDSAEALRKPGSAGRPLPGVTLAILDDDGRPLPQGQAGLIYVHQPAFADFSYVGNDAARQRMERAGLKTLGDVGYLDEDGFLYIVDRAADMVISGGVNIYPAEIEAVLQAMPGVADCAVFGIPDAEFGEALAAAVQLHENAQADAAGVREFLKSRLADYKVPKVVAFHAQMPREDTGKIFKRKLREPYWAGLTRRI
ncbi:MAG: AMP-binding protein [Burkholderiales bacterium]|nr:AMP-binding protein [Burkholderiales bacterium]